MRFRTILAGAVVTIALLALVSCEWLLGDGLSDLQRARAFEATANARPRDAHAMRAHFHPSMDEYVQMNTRRYWEGTSFGPDDPPFELSGLGAGDGIPGFPGATSLTGTIVSDNIRSTPIVFGFLPDPNDPGNRLIRYIRIDGIGEEIRSIR